ncbi:MAG: phosphoglucosamine mutase [Candidatus Lokiarchaeota archaeon]|nr:phosphoglucosamine mutase [Candidatus Lokiarchaeota archaeon]MBD3340671.1 phosphoglucosamine mutase [Candidatus Lokiarchaeota archaeon]
MTSNIFGTSGIRRVFQNYSETDVLFTPQMALDVGLALGTYLKGRGKVVIGKDIRTSALPIEHALIAGIVSSGCNVWTLGIVTTPTLAISLGYLNADAGVMITASHNTPEYIGLKMWNPSGIGFSPEQEEEISRIYDEKDFPKIVWDQVGKVTHINDINDDHISDITNRIDFDGSKLNVIVDPGNGSGCEIVPKLLSNYNVNIMTINAQMDGKFPGRNSEPSEKNLIQISKFLKISPQEDIGIALDGDADRVIFLDETGDIIDPVRLLALLAKYYIQENKDKLTIEDLKVSTPVNSSSLVEDVLEPLGCEIIRTEVGDIKVALALQNGGILGGETSGTYIWPKYHLGPDSIVTIAIVLQMIVRTGRSLKELLKEIPQYPYYRNQFKLKRDIPFTDEINQKIINEMKGSLKSANKELKSINKMDGVRFDYNDGWILIRRSGTSPYLRISGESSVDINSSIEMNKIAEEKMKKLDLI